jgi:hypothetical protein
MKRLIISLIMGSASALLTWWVFGGHFVPHHFGGFWEYLGDLIVIVSLPGLLVGIVASGNIHTGSTAVTVLVNFLFYFLATRFAFAIWQKRKAKSLRMSAPSGNQGPNSMQ